MDNQKIGQTIFSIPPVVVQALWKIIPYDYTPEDLQMWYLLMRYVYQSPLSEVDLATLASYIGSPRPSDVRRARTQGDIHQQFGSRLPTTNSIYNGRASTIISNSNMRQNEYVTPTLHHQPASMTLDQDRKRSRDTMYADAKRPCYDAAQLHQLMQPMAADQSSQPSETVKPVMSQAEYCWTSDALYTAGDGSDASQV